MATVSNNDQPEALLEGLLQATVCKEVVGWREETRRLIMVFTDQGYHIAGDGKVSKYSYVGFHVQVGALSRAGGLILHYYCSESSVDWLGGRGGGGGGVKSYVFL